MLNVDDKSAIVLNEDGDQEKCGGVENHSWSFARASYGDERHLRHVGQLHPSEIFIPVGQELNS